MAVSFTQRSWLELVRDAEPDFHFEGQHPEVYLWAGGKKARRDPGGDGGPYANSAVVQFAWATETGSAVFITEDGEAVFITEVKG